MKNKPSKILVFGATGRTGQIIIKNLLRKGYQVSAFVRNIRKAKRIKHDNYQVIYGSIHDYQNVQMAVRNHEIIISALGTSRILPNKIISRGVENIIKAMDECGIKRLIFQSSLGVGDSKGQLGIVYNLLLLPFLLYFIFKDKERQEKLITSSLLDWTIVRPAHFIPFSLPRDFRVLLPPERPRILPIMSRSHTADFMVKECQCTPHLKRKVTLSYF